MVWMPDVTETVLVLEAKIILVSLCSSMLLLPVLHQVFLQPPYRLNLYKCLNGKLMLYMFDIFPFNLWLQCLCALSLDWLPQQI